MLGLGTDLPVYEAKFWNGAVGANVSLLRDNRCPRVLHVVQPLGDLVLTRDPEAGGGNVTFTAADIAARQGVIYCGGYCALVATGSASHTILAGW